MKASQSLRIGVCLMGLATAALGSDVYVVRFYTGDNPAITGPNCAGYYWVDELLFHNLGTTDATVRFLGVSNGSPRPGPEPLTVAPGRTLSTLGAALLIAGTWYPNPLAPLSVAHLDVPDQIQLRSRALVPSFYGCNPFPGVGNNLIYAGVPLPVVRTLTAPGVATVHLGTDIGGDATFGQAFDRRLNIGVYNAGDATGSASIEVRQACDDSVIDRQSVEIPANTIVQARSGAKEFQGCATLNAVGFEQYVVVTVDQPSFSYVVTLSNDRLPWLPASSVF